MSSDTRYIHNRAKLIKRLKKYFFGTIRPYTEDTQANESIS